MLDGVPSGIAIREEEFAEDLSRRRAGKRYTTARVEQDKIQLLAGIYNGYTTGAPLLIYIANEKARSEDYRALDNFPRPGHADFVAAQRYKGFHDPRGGGNFSGRLTVGVVAAGVIAKKIIAPLEVKADVLSVGGEKKYPQILEAASKAGDSLGGVVECKVLDLPVGIGEPPFGGVEPRLAQMLMAIPGARGVEFGTGFAAANMRGSEHNDCIIDGRGTTATNHAGGVNGGITSGNPLTMRVAFKPTPSIATPQQTFNTATQRVEELRIEGRHDTAFVLRTPPIVEACVAIVLADLLLCKRAYDNE